MTGVNNDNLSIIPSTLTFTLSRQWLLLLSDRIQGEVDIMVNTSSILLLRYAKGLLIAVSMAITETDFYPNSFGGDHADPNIYLICYGDYTVQDKRT